MADLSWTNEKWYQNKRHIALFVLMLVFICFAGLFVYGTHRATVEHIVINEVSSNNFSIIQDDKGKYSDYVEFYNPTGQDIQMTDMFLSKKRRDNKQFSLEKVIAPAHGYAVVWLTGTEEGDGYHAPFKLSDKGDNLYLSYENGTMIDSVSIPALSYNTCYQRITDGNGEFVVATCSAGISNEQSVEVAQKNLNVPVFSVPSGFYEESVTLKISAPLGEEIYYTTDGSTPTVSSTKYTNSIEIHDPSAEENVYAAVNGIIMPSNYVPEEKVDKAFVVRAIAYDPLTKATSEVATQTYFMGYQNREQYTGYAMLSLVVDPKDLFDSTRGIYTAGDAYKEYLALGGFEDLDPEDVPSSFIDENGNEVYRYDSMNSSNGGRAWEREASITYFDEEHQLGFSQNAGVRISGESSRWKLQKSLNLYARDIYSDSMFSFPIFENDTPTSKIRLRTGSEGDLIYLDAMIQEMAEDTGLLYQRSKPCVVFLNGEYWGIYNIREQYTEEYFENLLGVPTGTVDVVKNMEVSLGDAESKISFEQVLNQIAYADMSDAEQRAFVENNMDLDNVAKFYAIMTYIDNQDVTDVHNRSAWRANVVDGAAPVDGKWRYMLYDLDASCNDPAFNTIEYYESLGDLSYLPQYLQADDSFKELYCKTMMDLANITYSARRAENVIHQWEQMYEKQITERHVRFMDNDTSMSDYQSELNSIRRFFRERREYMEQFLADDLGIEDDTQTISIENNNPQNGTVLVNGTALEDIDYEGQIWEGDYFTQYPVTVTAECNNGATFAGWYDQSTGECLSTDTTMMIDLSQGEVALETVFSK